MTDPSSTEGTDTLPYRQSVGGALAGTEGLSEADLAESLTQVAPALAELCADYETDRLPLLRMPERTDDIPQVEAALARLCAGARTLIFFGVGGSSFGGQALAQLAGWNIPGVADESQRHRPRTRFYDNLDPDTLGRVLGGLDLASTRFVVTSRSGNTPETLVQMMVALQAIEQAGLAEQIPNLFLAITGQEGTTGPRNGLRMLCRTYGIATLDHPPAIGGCYSVLTAVGLVPALARGLDVRSLRAGAGEVVQNLITAGTPGEIPAAVGAALNVALVRRCGVRVHVMMPYADRLGGFSQWFAQLWAESLAKDGKGTTPVACLGPADQHSLLQLLLDGPRDHLITLVRVATAGRGPRISPALAEAAGLDEMAGRTVGDLVAAEAHVIPDRLARSGRPVRTFDLDRLDERTFGALLMHFMLETILTARLLGVDPFDQPAAEASETLSRAWLQRGE